MGCRFMVGLLLDRSRLAPCAGPAGFTRIDGAAAAPGALKYRAIAGVWSGAPGSVRGVSLTPPARGLSCGHRETGGAPWLPKLPCRPASATPGSVLSATVAAVRFLATWFSEWTDSSHPGPRCRALPPGHLAGRCQGPGGLDEAALEAGNAGDPQGPGIDAQGRVLTVPQVNFHEHFYSRLAKGLDLGRPLDSFVHILEHFWWAVDRALDAPMVEACARLGALEAVRSGVTVVFDHHASPGCIEGSLDLIASALREAGLRGVVCYETSDRGGTAEALGGLEENRRFLQRAADGEVRGLVGLHASFTLSERTLQAASALVRELETGIHIHLSEDLHDRE